MDFKKQYVAKINKIIRWRLAFLFWVMLPVAVSGQVEICDNGIDDDNDNLVDLNDEDCACEILELKSLIPNPSFEEIDCCPNDRSQLYCASYWIQASEPTTDFIHLCNWLGWDDFPPPQPFPDGEGIMGFRDGRVIGNSNAEPYWKEYAGACLINPLLADTTYRFQFDVGFVDSEKSPPIDISFFGTSSCHHLPFGNGNEAFGCPSNDPLWKKLGEVSVSGGSGGSWVNTFIEIVPEDDIYAIAIGPDCLPVSSPISIYYFFDNLLLANLEVFDLQITEIGHPCSPDFVLSVADNPELNFQWYLSGIALEGEVFSQLTRNYGEGSYQVRIIDGPSCRLSAEYILEIPSSIIPARVAICQGDYYEFGGWHLTEPGFYLDTLKNQHNCDSIVPLELEVIGAKYDTIEASILNGEILEIGDYRIEEKGEHSLAFTSSIGCDSLVLLKLSTFDIYIPNVFSPNDDGVNDIFHPFGPDGLIKSVDLKIFNRWGNLIFQGTEWDGSNLQPDVFVYLIDIEFEQGNTKTFSGSVTLLK